MAIIKLAPPAWSNGELLSAGKANQLSACVNAIKAGAYAPAGTFYRTGNDATWVFRRRRWRYCHVTFKTSGVSCQTRIQINSTTVYNSGTLYPSGYTYTIDLNAVSGGPAVGDAYSVTVSYTATSATHETTGIVESSAATKTGAGSYAAPTNFTGSETPAQFLERVQALSSAVSSLAEVVVTPSATWLRCTDSTTYERRRKLRYLIISFIASGDNPSVRVLVNGTSVLNVEAGGTYTIDLNAVSGGPAVRDFYSLEVRKQAGVLLLNTIEESATPSSSIAPQWSHGALIDGVIAPAAWQQYCTVLNDAHAVLGAAGWQMPCIRRPYDHPRWGLHKTKRYLHYMRNGSMAAALQDPAGVQDDIGLSRTHSASEWATYDLDTIDWLSPGGLLYVYEADAVWLDDDP